MSTLVGLFFVRNSGPRSCCGRVVSEPLPGHYLLSFDPADGGVLPPLELVCACDMLGDGDDGVAAYGFFSKRLELDAWMKWLTEPGEGSVPRVVSFGKPKAGAQP